MVVSAPCLLLWLCLTLAHAQKLTPVEGTPDDSFGHSISMSGDKVAVGAPGGGIFHQPRPGSAYVFTCSFEAGGGCTQFSKLTASDGADSDTFGSSISMSGDKIAVGAGDKLSEAGAAYIFSCAFEVEGVCAEVTKLTPLDTATDDFFGCSISLEGDHVAVGARGGQNNGTATGSAYVFSCVFEAGGGCTEFAKLVASDGADGDSFGSSISLSGDAVAVGAVGDDGQGKNSGSAYIFSCVFGPGGGCTQVAKITALDGSRRSFFGSSISMSGDKVAVGADGADLRTGSAYIFSCVFGPGGGCLQLAKLTASDGYPDDSFGDSISISGDKVVVGALYEGESYGAAYVFSCVFGAEANCTEILKLTLQERSFLDCFGSSVSLSGDRVAVGAINDDETGSASIFRLPLCEAGTYLYGSACVATCPPGFFGKDQVNTCQEVDCAAETVGITSWPSAAAGDTATGTCLGAYSSAETLTRECLFNKTWSSTISGSCSFGSGTITAVTSTKTHASSRGAVTLTFVGSQGEVGPIVLGSSFLKGGSSSKTVDLSPAGEIHYLTISKRRPTNAWIMDHLSLNGEAGTMMFGSDTVVRGAATLNAPAIIRVKTRTSPDAGTQSTIYITFVSTSGEQDSRVLGKGFAPGGERILSVPHVNLEDLASVELGNFSNDGWDVEEVEVRLRGVSYLFGNSQGSLNSLNTPLSLLPQ